ncbi:MAG: S41 family peptidase [Finegoldia magna]|uniref:S41 family peptidase n=1 Tax=Finegoldia magna TaxID=1260 RepID=UPI000B9196AD|nr:S41 family peptidase [Finegoldia magna]MDU1011120.1 S41 family peptidase [Finegoldia magna]MDU1086786.1 S41 family peptidase [Finegoldia magna]OXZ38281.1 peptidase S41 [Finegoldia magna]
MKTSHNRANKQRKRNKIANKIFLLVLLLILGFFGYKYINSRPAEYKQLIPKKYILRDFDELCNQIENSYMNLPQTKKYKDTDFLSLKPNFKSKIKLESGKKKDEMTTQEVFDLYNDILKKLYDSNVRITDKHTFNEILQQDNHNQILNNLSMKRYSNLAEEIPEKTFRAYSIDNYKDALYVKVSDFDSVNIQQDAQIFSNILKTNKKKNKIIIDLRDNDSDNLDYAINVIIKPLLKSDINVEFNVANKTQPIISKNILDRNGISFKTTENVANIKINDNQKNIKYITNFNLAIKKSEEQKCDVYILQNKNTRNSADFVCQIANRTKFATTVGETTSGNGLNIVHTYKALPNTGLIIEYPLGQGLNEDGTTNEEVGTIPAIKLDDNSEIVKLLLSRIN